jgi:hypothetical protein
MLIEPKDSSPQKQFYDGILLESANTRRWDTTRERKHEKNRPALELYGDPTFELVPAVMFLVEENVTVGTNRPRFSRANQMTLFAGTTLNVNVNVNVLEMEKE